MGALTAHDHPRALGPALKVKGRGELGHLSVSVRGVPRLVNSPN